MDIQLHEFVHAEDPDWVKEEVAIFESGPMISKLTGLGIIAAFGKDPSTVENWIKAQNLSRFYPEIQRGLDFRLRYIQSGMADLLVEKKVEERDEEWKVAFHLLTLMRDNLACLVYILRLTDIEVPLKTIYDLDILVGTAVSGIDGANLRFDEPRLDTRSRADIWWDEQKF